MNQKTLSAFDFSFTTGMPEVKLLCLPWKKWLKTGTQAGWPLSEAGNSVLLGTWSAQTTHCCDQRRSESTTAVALKVCNLLKTSSQPGTPSSAMSASTAKPSILFKRSCKGEQTQPIWATLDNQPPLSISCPSTSIPLWQMPIPTSQSCSYFTVNQSHLRV